MLQESPPVPGRSGRGQGTSLDRHEGLGRRRTHTGGPAARRRAGNQEQVSLLSRNMEASRYDVRIGGGSWKSRRSKGCCMNVAGRGSKTLKICGLPSLRRIPNSTEFHLIEVSISFPARVFPLHRRHPSFLLAREWRRLRRTCACAVQRCSGCTRANNDFRDNGDHSSGAVGRSGGGGGVTFRAEFLRDQSEPAPKRDLSL